MFGTAFSSSDRKDARQFKKKTNKQRRTRTRKRKEKEKEE